MQVERSVDVQVEDVPLKKARGGDLVVTTNNNNPNNNNNNPTVLSAASNAAVQAAAAAAVASSVDVVNVGDDEDDDDGVVSVGSDSGLHHSPPTSPPPPPYPAGSAAAAAAVAAGAGAVLHHHHHHHHHLLNHHLHHATQAVQVVPPPPPAIISSNSNNQLLQQQHPAVTTPVTAATAAALFHNHHNHLLNHHHHHNNSSQQLPQQQQQQQQQQQPSTGTVVRQEKSGSTTSAAVTPPTPAASLLANKYILLNPTEGCPLHKCIDIVSEQEYVCRVVGRDCISLVTAHFRLDGHPRINSLHEVVLGEEFMYLVFPDSYGDLHSYVRQRKRLRESEAKRLFRQVAETVKECHEQGVVLRDLKLRKFVFSNPSRTELKLESLEDAVVLEKGEDDVLQDKRGCPAYVSPEILRSHARYSGRAADMWSLGVILYTMLVGRYPFNDAEHGNLFVKISRGFFVMPDCLSSRARCLIRSLLRRNPAERLTAEDVLIHPWLTHEERCYHSLTQDQVVPDF